MDKKRYTESAIVATVSTFLGLGNMIVQAQMPQGSEDGASTSKIAVPKVSESRSSAIEEVVVTAQRKAESLQEVPMSVSALTSENMRDFGIFDMKSIGENVPGLTVAEGGWGTTTYHLRGVGYNDQTYFATNTVGFYIDEINLPYSPMTAGPILDIERLEVLKGPQGTLYGRNTTAGLINFIPKSPTDSFEAGLTVSYDRFETIDTEMFVSSPITDTLKFRVAGRQIKSDKGWQKSITRPDDTLGEKDQSAARIILDWDSTEDLSFSFMINGWKDTGDSQAPQPVAVQLQSPFPHAEQQGHPRIENYPYVPNTDDPQLADWVPEGGSENSTDGRVGTEKDNYFLMGSIKADWAITESLSLLSNAAIMRVRSDGTSLLMNGVDVYNTDGNLYAYIDSWSFETRLTGAFWDERFQWSLGFNMSDDRADEVLEQTFDTISFFGPYHPGQKQNDVATGVGLQGGFDSTQKGIFINTDTDLSDTLTLTAAVRYSTQEQQFNSCSYEPEWSEGTGLANAFTVLSAQAAAEYFLETGELGDPAMIGKGPGECYALGEDGNNRPVDRELEEDNTSWRLALRWLPTPDMNIYGSVSRGYKFGGFPVFNAARKNQYQPATQESLTAYEIGIKDAFFDRSLKLGSSIFYYNYVDKQLLTRVQDEFFGPLPVLRNAPRSYIYGAEVEAGSKPLPGLFVSLSATYVESEILEFQSTNFTGQPENFRGKPFNFSPKYQASFSVNYTLPLFDEFDVRIGADMKYSSDTNGTLEQAPAYHMPSWTQYGANIKISDVAERWSVLFWGRNLSNELVSQGTFNLGDTVVRYVSMPRNYGATFTYNAF